MVKISKGLGCVFAAVLTASVAQANECGEVSIMQGDWGSAQIVFGFQMGSKIQHHICNARPPVRDLCLFV